MTNQTIKKLTCKKCGWTWIPRKTDVRQCPHCKTAYWNVRGFLTPKVAALTLLFLLASCAGYRPIVDMQNVNPGKYETDLHDCQAYAEQVSPAIEGVTGAAIGAGIGAVLGAVVGSFIGEAGRGAGIGAAIGGTQGAVQGTGGGVRGQVDIIRNCMAGRGYRILR